MNTITLLAHAKINLALDILGRENGYHLIQTVYHLLDLHDEVTIEKNHEQKIICEGKLATQAAELFQKTAGTDQGFTITFKKNIPYYSGLGGASSCAAAVLKGLNTMHENPLTHKQLVSLAEKLGMDVPFFMSGVKAAIGRHFGEKIEPLPCELPNSLSFKLHFSDEKKSSTRDMYEKLDLKKCSRNKEKTAMLIEAMKLQDAQKILENLHNDFEQLWVAPEQQQGGKLLLAGAGPTWVMCKSL